jgi:hypothetical protein
LYVGTLEYATRENSLQCRIPSGHLVTIKITAKQFTETGLIRDGVWYYEPSSLSNWTATDFDDATRTQTFVSSASGVTADGRIMFDEGTFQIDYFENGFPEPVMTKTIEVDY